MSTFGRSQVAAPKAPVPAAATRRHGQTTTWADSPLPGSDQPGSPLTPLPEGLSFEPSIPTEDTQRPPTPSPAPRTASPQPQLISQPTLAPQSAPLTHTGSPTITDPTADIGRQLHGLFAQLTSTQLVILQELRANRTTAPEPPRTEPPVIPNPPPVAAAPEFLPPLNSNGNGESLRTYFPDIPEATLLAIWRNTFAARDLYKLDKEAKTRGDFNKVVLDDGYLTTREREANNKDYPNWLSLSHPLNIYFDILEIMIIYRGDRAAAARFTHGINTYRDDLYTLYLEFEWPAVLEYHFKFHAARIVEMENGIYGGWGERDTILLNCHLFGKPRTRTKEQKSKTAVDVSKQPCFDWNFRQCTRAKCNRIHKCKTCDSSDHPASSCPKKSQA
ncbi:hypothetical protein M422DRAFT_70745 [Sphaerobolus stellatus SS14]|uniref:Uncharacterized protein n=1 Tax=Sphaerobolus stellatus (strain SS14) TaxID=990650 RepID=A0A0C9TPQ9_SPHS4|nr:hypothetical protein M422DRAFT_70745 [Sphaerobolus stellatus SS14]